MPNSPPAGGNRGPVCAHPPVAPRAPGPHLTLLLPAELRGKGFFSQAKLKRAMGEPEKSCGSPGRATQLWHPAPKKPLAASIDGRTHLQHLSYSPCSESGSHIHGLQPVDTRSWGISAWGTIILGLRVFLPLTGTLLWLEVVQEPSRFQPCRFSSAGSRQP